MEFDTSSPVVMHYTLDPSARYRSYVGFFLFHDKFRSFGSILPNVGNGIVRAKRCLYAVAAAT